MTANRFNFRVWDKEDKYFLDRVLIDDNGSLIYHYRIPTFGMNNHNIKAGLSYLDKEDYVLMQSTGLVDKNGKEIFEGDIIEFSTFRVVVKWEDCRFKIKSSCCDLALDIIRAEKCEVLGNIYENPELLED